MKYRWFVALFVFVLLLISAVVGLSLQTQRRQYALNRKLIAALVHDDTKEALELVNAGADVNTPLRPNPAPSLKRLLVQLFRHSPPPGNDSPTAFMIACGWPEMVQKGGTVWGDVRSDGSLVRGMFQHGAQVKLRGSADQTLLIHAVWDGDAETVDLILQHGAGVNETNAIGQTALLWAVRGQNEVACKVLLAHHADANLRDHDGYTPLYAAVADRRSVSIIQRLLASGADPTIATDDGITPITKAREQKRPDIVALLQHRGKP